MTTNGLDTARANLHAALDEEGEALASACDAVKTSGADSPQAAEALRAAQMAHARSNAAVGEVRALNAQVARADAAAEVRAPGDAGRAAHR